MKSKLTNLLKSKQVRRVLSGRVAKDFKLSVKCLSFIFGREDRVESEKLCEDTPDRPHVYTKKVVLTPKDDLWGSVPEGDNRI